MKRFMQGGVFRWGLFLCFFLCSRGLLAKPSEVFHFYGVTASGGYSQFMTNYGNVSTAGRSAFSLGLGYELRFHSLWVQTGLEGRYMGNQSKYSNPLDIYADAMDTQGKPFTMHYLVNAYSEQENLFSLQVPLLIGYYSANGFYFGGGIKLGGSVFSSVQADVSYRTEGIYSQYSQSMEDMSNHYYSDYNISSTGKAKAGFVGSALFEIGADVLSARFAQLKSNTYVLKVAAYGEVGFGNPYTKQAEETNLLEPDAANAQMLRPKSVYNINLSGDYYFVPYSVGVKLTYLFYMTPYKKK